jgi:sugar lactone lactonase YvrE
MTPECVWPLAAELGEGPIWWRAAVWFTDIKGCKVHRFDPASGTGKSWDAPAPVGFLAPLKTGHFIAGARTGLMDFDPGTGAFTPLCVAEPGLPGNRLNDGAVDRKGRLWFGSMDDSEGVASGALYRLTEAGPRVMDGGIVITNGPAFSPDGRTLYHTDTLGKAIYAFDLAEDGTLSNKRLFVTIEDGAGWPDGPVVDNEGCLWTGLFGGWSARRYGPDGALADEVRFPVANVTKLAFGGDDGRTVYATTAWKGLTADQRAAQPLAGGLFRFRGDVPGQPQQAVTVIPRGTDRPGSRARDR